MSNCSNILHQYGDIVGGVHCAGLCGFSAAAALLLASNEPVVVPYQPVIDGNPPQLNLLGDPPGHVRAFDALGKVMVITTHVTGTAYEDAGVFARDFVDGVPPPPHQCCTSRHPVVELFKVFRDYLLDAR